MKTIAVILLSGIFFTGFAQETRNTVDVWGVGINLIGASVNYEKSLGNNFTAKSEIDYQGGFFKSTSSNDLDFVFTTVLALEPRYYYNLNKRKEKGKNVNKNSANFLSTEIFYVPDFLTASNNESIHVYKSVGVIPKFGLRRSLSSNLIFEFAVGVGYSWGESNTSGFIPALDLKLNLAL